MKNINRIRCEIAELQYENAYGCVELKLFLLGLLQDISKQYQQASVRSEVKYLLRSFKELEGLYKSFDIITEDPKGNYKAQFEFAKALITDHVDRLYPAQQMMHVA